MKVKFTLLLLLLNVGISYAQTIRYVKPTASGNGSGTSWANASADFQGMINASSANDQVWVAKGTYKPTTGTDRSISFSMKNGVGIYGGFAGTETQLSQRNWVTNETILSGEIGNQANVLDNSYHVIFNNDNGLTISSVLNGFTITRAFGGTESESFAASYGAGILNFLSVAPLITNCIFKENSGESTGAGIINTNNSTVTSTSSTTTITNCLFYNNVNFTFSAGIWTAFGANANVTNCTFYGNFIGIILNNVTQQKVKNCIFWGNLNGQIYDFTNNVSVTNSLLAGGFSGTGNIDKDPLFVNASNVDFRLQACSPAINAGDNTGISGVDIANNPRIYNNGIVDIGAYEYQGAAITAPTAVSISTNSVCRGTSVNLSATCASGTITWYNTSNGGTALGTGSPFSYVPSVGNAQTFYASCVGSCESSRTASLNKLNVNALPTATANSNSAICSGMSLNLSSSGGTAFAWTGVNSFSSSQQNPSIPSATTLATGTYQVRITDANGCTALATTSAIVNALPTATANSNSPICAGTTLSLSASGGTAFAWTGVNSFSSSQQNPSIASATTLATGTYQVRITDGNGCTAVATTSAIVNALPTATALSNSPICTGTTLNLSASGGTAFAWTGVNSFSSSQQNPSIPSATTLATGTYQVRITDANGCTALATTSAIVNALPTATANNNSPVCAGTTLNLSASSGTAFAWTGVNSFSSSQQNPSIASATTLATGTYQVRITDVNGCTAVATTSAIVNALPTATALSNSPICTGTTLNLSASGGTAFAWTGVNSFSSSQQNPSIPSATTLATGTYQVRITDANGCTALATTSAIVNALPTATANSNSPVCAGTTLNLSASSGTAFAWTGVNSFSSSQQNPNINSVSTLATGTYQLTVTDANGCKAIATTSVTVNALPTATASSNTPICAGTTLNLSASGGVSYTWTGVNSFSSTLQNPTINTAPTLATGTYQVVVTNDAGCTAIATTSVTVNALPTATASSNTPICAGTTLNLSASSGTAFAWTGVNSFSSSQQNPNINSVSTLATGTYQLTVTDANGCTAIATTSVTVNALPTATASSNTPICAGTTLNLSASGGVSYTWTGVNSFSSTLQNPTINTAPTLATGTYQVLVTNDVGCTAIATTSVTVNALPTATASSNTPICAGTTLNLSASSGTAFAWTGVNSFSSSQQNPNINSVSTLATGTYKLTVTDANGCTAIATTSVTVNALPTATASSNTPICAGKTLNLSASSGVSYTWTGVNSFSSTLQNPTINTSPTLATGTYQVRITDVNGCTAVATTSAIVNALPTATANSTSPICSGTSLNLSSSGGTAFAWTGVNSFSSSQQNPSIPSATTLATGTYQVRITDANGCTALATTSAIVNALPTATANSNSPVCAGTTLNLSASSGTAFAWTGVNSFSSTLQNPTINTAPTLATGTYQVLVTNDVGCTAIATTSVTVNALPTATASNNSPVCAGTPLNLSSSGGVSYTWTGVNSFSSTLQNPTINTSPTLATGTYQVLVTNDVGCTAIATTSVNVNPVPVTPTTQANTQIIFGGSVTLTVTGCSNENDVLKWYQSTNNVLVTMPVSPTVTSNYYATCETTLNGITCISPQSADVTVTVLSPTPPVATGGTTCISTPLSLTATGCSGSTGTFVLKWYQNSDNTLITMPVSPNVTTDYYAKCEQTFNSITAVSDKSNVVTLTVLNPAIPVATGTKMYNGNSTTLSSTGCTGEGFVVKWYETATNNLVTMPVSPIVTTQYYAKCEQTAVSVTCISAKSNDVTLKVVNRIFVDIAKASAPIQNGNSWATAFGNLQTGLAAATASVEVWVAKGTYKTTTTLDRTICFNIPNNVIVYGGFAGTENALSERNFTTNVSTLSGGIGNQEIITDNSYHVVVFNGSSSNTRLDGFNITGGNANFDPKRVGALPAMTPTSSNIETGGGILVQNGASPVITNCSVVNNSAVFGGGIYATDASLPQLLACKFMGNEATFGSGVYFQNGSHATINNTLISGNRGMGGLYNNNSNPTITNTTLSGNGGYNGGIFNSNSQPVVKNSIIWGNSTPFNDTQSVITNSIIQGGYAGTGNLNYDPQFVNQAPEGLSPNLNGDYHLKASSLGIDRGDNGSISTTDLDLDGNLRRFNGGRVDLGAYEFQGNGTSNVVISIASGNWESNSTWDINRVPQIGDIVIIDQNHIVTLNSQGNAKNIEYRGTGQLKFNSTNSKLNIGF